MATNGLTGAQRNAYTAVQQMLRQYGLESLAPQLLGFVRQGFSSDTIVVQLQETKEWKKRFAANEARVKAGLPVLSPAEYLATETAYRQVMSAAGLPRGFYDQASDFTAWLAKDVSPTEIQQRVQAASDIVNTADKETRDFFSKWYTKGDMIAFALDQKRAAPLVGKAFEAAKIGGAAAAQGLDIGQGLAETLAGEGVSRQQAQAGFSQVAREKVDANRLADIYDEAGFTTEDLAREAFLADGDVGERRKRLASRERGAFSGSSGVTQGTLGRSSSGL